MRRSASAAPSLRRGGALRFRRRALEIDRLELALLAAFAVASVWVLALDLWQVVAHGRVWTGTDGSFIVDQMQYLAWIVSASRHLLVANLFVLHTTPADYFQPAIAISGGLTALGMAPTLALLVWKPVAVVSLFCAVRAYAHRGLGCSTRGQRLAMLALALFFGSFTVLDRKLAVIGDLFPAFLSWGYPFALMAIAAAIFALLAYDRARATRSFSWGPALLGALAGLLHPWQGELLIVIIVAAELTDLRAGAPALAGLRPALGSARLRLASATLLGTLMPLIYYAALGKLDISWQLARLASKHSFPVLDIAAATAPLLLVALLGYHATAGGFLARATRIWPAAAFAVYIVSSSGLGATPLHAFDGITVPLALLAVDGWRRLHWGRLRTGCAIGTAVVAIGTVPATVYLVASERGYVAPAAGNANFITHDEGRALAFLRHDPQHGGVMTRFYLGAVVPARTGRATFVGNCIWSQPACNPRAIEVQSLLDGSLPPLAARLLVAGSHARFLLADCQQHTSIARELGTLIASVHRFGCATVYMVNNAPLPESSGYAAAVRAPRRQ
ncbi:MAG: hypothetical protein ACLP8S_27245 [Solirubrobacteraceae bacterium]